MFFATHLELQLEASSELFVLRSNPAVATKYVGPIHSINGLLPESENLMIKSTNQVRMLSITVDRAVRRKTALAHGNVIFAGCLLDLNVAFINVCPSQSYLPRDK